MILPFRICIFLLLVAIVGLQARLWSGPGSFAHVSRLKERVLQHTAENQSASARNDSLKAEILDLKNGLEGVEELARSELGLIKKGETFFLVVED